MKKEYIVTLDDYHIDFSTGLGEAHYHKSDWTLEEALKDQAEM